MIEAIISTERRHLPYYGTLIGHRSRPEHLRERLPGHDQKLVVEEEILIFNGERPIGKHAIDLGHDADCLPDELAGVIKNGVYLGAAARLDQRPWLLELLNAAFLVGLEVTLATKPEVSLLTKAKTLLLPKPKPSLLIEALLFPKPKPSLLVKALLLLKPEASLLELRLDADATVKALCPDCHRRSNSGKRERREYQTRCPLASSSVDRSILRCC